MIPDDGEGEREKKREEEKKKQGGRLNVAFFSSLGASHPSVFGGYSFCPPLALRGSEDTHYLDMT